MFDEYNTVARRVLGDSSIIHWPSFTQSSSSLNDTLDGVHLGPQSKAFIIDSIMNFLCNDHVGPTKSNICCARSTSLITYDSYNSVTSWFFDSLVLLQFAVLLVFF